MSKPLAVDSHGNVMTEVRVADLQQLADAAQTTPCPLALVVLLEEAAGKVLFGLNRWRREYELPGGMIDDGESPRDAAARELREETGIGLQPKSLQFLGYARFAMAQPVREELGAVFVADSVGHHPGPSEELEAFCWREPLSSTGLKLSAIDDVIADWAVGQGRPGHA